MATLCGSWDYYKKDEKSFAYTEREGLKVALDKTYAERREQQKVERGRSEQIKYGSLEFWPGRRIGTASETQHMKRGNLGNFSICYGGGLHKCNDHSCAPRQTQRSSSPSRNPTSLPLSIFQASSSARRLSSPPLTLVVSQVSISPAVLAHIPPTPYVNSLYFIKIIGEFFLFLFNCYSVWLYQWENGGVLMSLFFHPH